MTHADVTVVRFAKGEIAQFIWFDTGGAATGWAHFAIHIRAFTGPQWAWEDHVRAWNTGEFRGTETRMAQQCIERVLFARWGPPSLATSFPMGLFVGTESFDRQPNQRGGDEVLSPVRINAMLQYGLYLQCPGIELLYQGRSMRVQVTKERLTRWGYGWKGKDSFAAMQHVVTFIRRTKQEADRRPWRYGR